ITAPDQAIACENRGSTRIVVVHVAKASRRTRLAGEFIRYAAKVPAEGQSMKQYLVLDSSGLISNEVHM
ncbi:MAG: hypothetical protein DRI81_10410, partial [Chloroflexi bacterium]